LPDINKTFFDMINQEDWSEDVYTGTEEEGGIVMKNFITIPTPHPHFFINLTFEYEYNPKLGDDLFGEI
tara:strand:- start:16968 stop:17174 length:207 start_codon:yes stop_codon:yes gene_type:complete